MLFDAVFTTGATDVQIKEELLTWDPDDLRAMALTAQQLYRVGRNSWYELSTQLRSTDEPGGNTGGG